MRVTRPRVEPDGFRQIRNGFIQSALICVSNAAATERFSIRGVKSNRFSKRINSSIIVLLTEI